MIQRTLIIGIYLILISIMIIATRLLLGNFIGGITEVFLYSYLNSYYCYEYKTAALDVNVKKSIRFFE